MRPAEKIKKLFVTSNVAVSPELDERMISAALAAFEKSGKTKPAVREPGVWRMIMNKPITKCTAAAVIIIAVLLSLDIFHQSTATASATEVFKQAFKVASSLSSVHIKAQMRAPGRGDNLRTIDIDADFVPVEMWKEFGSEKGKWRIENPARKMVCDGNSTIQLMGPLHAHKTGAYDTGRWFPLSLLDVGKIIDRELIFAKEHGSNFELTHEVGDNGSAWLVVVVEAKALGDFTNDYLKNRGFEMSDHTRIYTFDEQTKKLESLEVYVHTEDEDVLVFEVTDVKYNPDTVEDLFTLELPDDVIWLEEPEVLSDNERYQQMGPKEMATAFFEACASEDWEEYLKFNPASEVSREMKDYLGGLQIISIGEPFKSGLYPGWFVPYEIKLKSGHIKKHNLALRNDNRAGRYVVDGGL